jgi:hypothetical protein
LEERERKAKANRKVMGKIVYKEWKERKVEESRLRAKIQRQMRLRGNSAERDQ